LLLVCSTGITSTRSRMLLLLLLLLQCCSCWWQCYTEAVDQALHVGSNYAHVSI
jgi:hypothetical protein